MANGLLLRLRERELSASPAERNVIAYVSAHPHEVVGLSVRGLADVTFSPRPRAFCAFASVWVLRATRSSSAN